MQQQVVVVIVCRLVSLVWVSFAHSLAKWVQDFALC